jgi:hypothetical protein
MAENPSYSQLLRPVGQMLEGLHVESFELKVEGDEFLVRGTSDIPTPQPTQEKTLRVVWQVLRGRASKKAEAPIPSSGAVELRYSQDDIARMEREGRARRQSAGQTPEAHTISQVLRAVGAFVDHKGGRFLSVSKDDQAVTIEYETSLRRNSVETFTISTLYDFWVRMYKKRGRGAES